MYSGFGGQVLYLARDAGWGVDVDATGSSSATSKAGSLTATTHHDGDRSLNYRLAKGVTATLRAGRFLAKDDGARVEMKRRFASAGKSAPGTR